MKRSIIILFVIVCAVFSLSGCNFTDFDIQSLMKPPRPTGEKAYIQTAIEEKAGRDIILKYPQRGEFRSSIIMVDLTGDGQEEAVALYQPKDEESGTHVMIIDEADGAWKCIKDFKNEASEIDKICFGDIDGDGKNEVIIGWSGFNTSSKHISIYTYSNSGPQEISINETYSEFIVFDFDDDNYDEILTLSTGTTDSPAAARLLKPDGSTFSVRTIGVVETDSAITKYSCVTVGNINSYQKGVIVDGSKLSSTFVTEILYWDKEKQSLVSPVNDKKTGECDFAKRGSFIKSYDINNDGIIEIPIVSASQAYSSQNTENTSYLIKWCTFDTKTSSIKPVKEVISNYDDGYHFVLPESWHNKVNAKIDPVTKALTISEWIVGDSDIGAAGAYVLKIQSLSAKEWDSTENKTDYTIINKTSERVYVYSIPQQNSDLSLSEAQIKENFELINLK